MAIKILTISSAKVDTKRAIQQQAQRIELQASFLLKPLEKGGCATH